MTNEGRASLDDPERLARASRLLDRDADPGLKALVETAARETGWPLALVTLVLRRTQYFLAHVGLPPDLQVARALDRSASFCQFVVASGGPLEVEDAVGEPNLPQEMVTRYGVRSYVGLPLCVDDRLVGSFCVVDVKARRMSPAERVALERLAEHAGRRLRDLSAESARRLASHAVEPAFGEIRNILTALQVGLGSARMAAAELSPFVQLADAAARGKLTTEDLQRASGLQRADSAYRDFTQAVGRLEDVAGRLTTTLTGLEATLASRAGAPPSLASAVDAASRTVLHVTKLIGGVRWEPLDPALRVRPAGAAAASSIAAALRQLADRMAPGSVAGIDGRVEIGARGASVVLRADEIAAATCAEVAADLRMLFGDVDVDVAAVGSELRLVWAHR